MLFGQVGIDVFAGPSEVAVIADDTADPAHRRLRPRRPGRARARVAGVALHDLAARWPSDVMRARAAAHRRAAADGARRGRRGVARLRRGGPVRHARGGRAGLRPLRAGAPRGARRATSTGGSRGSPATARSSSARRPRWPSATRPRARTTSCRRKGAARYSGGLSVHKFIKTVTWQRHDARGEPRRSRRSRRGSRGSRAWRRTRAPPTTAWPSTSRTSASSAARRSSEHDGRDRARSSTSPGASRSSPARNSGIGGEIARALAEAGAAVVLRGAARAGARGGRGARSRPTAAGPPRIACDLADRAALFDAARARAATSSARPTSSSTRPA